MAKRSAFEPRAIQLFAEGMEIPEISRVSDEEGWKTSENTLRQWKNTTRPTGGGLDEWEQARADARSSFLSKMDEVGARLRRSREIAAALGGKAGLKGQGEMGIALNELVRSLLWDISAKIQTEAVLDPEEMDATIAQLNRISLTLQRLEQASNLNLKREAEIRRQALDDVTKAIDAATGGEASRPMTADDFKKIIRESYGV